MNDASAPIGGDGFVAVRFAERTASDVRRLRDATTSRQDDHLAAGDGSAILESVRQSGEVEPVREVGQGTKCSLGVVADFDRERKLSENL